MMITNLFWRRTVIFNILILLPFLGSSQAIEVPNQASKRKRIEIKVSAGISYLSIRDWNKYMESSSTLRRDLASLFHYDIGGEFKKIRYGSDIEVNIIYYFTSRFGVSLGSGCIYGKKGRDSSRIASHQQFFTEIEMRDTHFEVVPFKIGLYYSLPINSDANLFLNGGVGYYITRWVDKYRREWDGYWETIEQKASDRNLGVYGGAGIEIKIFENFFFTLEGYGRYLRLKNLKGSFDYRNSGSWIDYYEGTLRYYERDLSLMGLDCYSVIEILDVDPALPSFRNIRNAIFDFSGFILRVGIIMKF